MDIAREHTEFGNQLLNGDNNAVILTAIEGDDKVHLPPFEMNYSKGVQDIVDLYRREKGSKDQYDVLWLCFEEPTRDHAQTRTVTETIAQWNDITGERLADTTSETEYKMETMNYIKEFLSSGNRDGVGGMDISVHNIDELLDGNAITVEKLLMRVLIVLLPKPGDEFDTLIKPVTAKWPADALARMKWYMKTHGWEQAGDQLVINFTEPPLFPDDLTQQWTNFAIISRSATDTEHHTEWLDRAEDGALAELYHYKTLGGGIFDD